MRVLFLCTGNSCRSQMAEGLLRTLACGEVESFSAGTEPRGVNPLTVEVMSTVGIDISGQTSKHLDVFRDLKFDYVITVCDRAKESCPKWPDAKEDIHWSVDDPATADGTEPAHHAFETARNTIAHRIRLFLLSHRISVNGSKAVP